LDTYETKRTEYLSTSSTKNLMTRSGRVGHCSQESAFGTVLLDLNHYVKSHKIKICGRPSGANKPLLVLGIHA
jgi:hypothetical protein